MGTVPAKQDYAALSELSPEQQLAAGEDLLFDLGGAIEDDQIPQRHTVMIGNIGLVLPANEISELVEKVVVCSMPNTLSWFNGVTAVRGNMIPVFDLHDLFSIEHPATRRRLIVVGQNETAAAFWVDDFPRLLKLGDEDLSAKTPSIPDLVVEHALRYFEKDGQDWVEWDFKSFFAALGEQL